jgi:hypothetical protein
MLSNDDRLEVKWNLEILGFDRGKRRILHQRTHNIVVNNGRQFIVEALSASAFGGGGFTRVQNHVVRYIGVGIGGTRQSASEASNSPLADTYPDGYGGANIQTDEDLTVSRLERPVKATPSLWLKQVAAPPAFPSATSVTYSALFDAADLNLAPHVQMPISEIGLYSSGADPAQPNGGSGTYPGATSHMIAYDTFITLHKTGFWALLVNWTWQI